MILRFYARWIPDPFKCPLLWDTKSDLVWVFGPTGDEW